MLETVIFKIGDLFCLHNWGKLKKMVKLNISYEQDQVVSAFQ